MGDGDDMMTGQMRDFFWLSGDPQNKELKERRGEDKTRQGGKKSLLSVSCGELAAKTTQNIQ